MPLVINTNIASVTAQRHLDASRTDMERAMERLASGQRVNHSMDDAAGMSIIHSLDCKINSLNMATRNATDAVSLVHLAEGGLEAVSEMLVRMRELSTQATNGTYSQYDRSAINLEFQQLAEEITRISNNTFFNGVAVIGSDDTVVFQIGHDATDQIEFSFQDMDVGLLGSTHFASAASFTVVASGTAGAVTQDLDDAQVSTLLGARRALTIVDNALQQVDLYRVEMGAIANRLEHTHNNLLTRIEQQTAARSRIEDADYAVESANLARAQILQQAGTAMLSQANASTQNVLELLK
jgi:flagellin